MDSRRTSTGFTRRPTVEEWSRMSWRARQQFVRGQKQAAKAHRRHYKKRGKQMQQMEQKYLKLEDRPHRQDQLQRCSKCGGWMLDQCWTGCAS